MLSRILHGARTSLGRGAPRSMLAAALRRRCSGWSAARRERADAVIMRLVDIQLSLPYLLFAIAVMALLEPWLPT